MILRETMLTQAEATSGVSPSSRPGTTNSIVQDKASLGRLISASKLPASDSSERLLVLDASSSTSPLRGSMMGFIADVRALRTWRHCFLPEKTPGPTAANRIHSPDPPLVQHMRALAEVISQPVFNIKPEDGNTTDCQ